MTIPVAMPQLGLEVTEGTVTDVFVAVGQQVRKDEPVLELATDKAQTDVVAPSDGIVEAIDVQVGDTVPVGAVMLRLTSADAPEPLLRAAPAARRAAERLGVDLATVTGTGPRDRITLEDVERASAAAPVARGTAALGPPPPAALEPLSPLRRAVARRMTASQLIPQFHLSRELDATHLLAAGANVNDLLVQAAAQTVVRHRDLAVTYEDEGPALRRRPDINVGLAVASAAGLVVPVIQHADRLSLEQLAEQRQTLVTAARAGRLSLGQMEGGVITISNLGGLGVDAFAAMVNPGEAAIVAVGRVVDRLVPRNRGIAVRRTLTLTMTFDHRVVDGAAGAAALADLTSLLEGETT